MKTVGGLNKIYQTANVGLMTTIVLLMITISAISPYFMTWYNMEVLSMGFVQEAIMALGMTVVIISGGIDLSVGSVLVFTAIVVGKLLNANVSIPAAIAITLLVAGSIGFLNALAIIRLRAHPFIVTLGSMTIVRGLAFVFTEGKPVTDFPEEFSFFGQGYFLYIPFPVFLFILLAILFSFLLRKNRFFHQIYFIGSNKKSAHLCGMDVQLCIYVIYILSALLAGIAGIITASQYISANATFGIDAELRVITAVIIGGASLSGGVGSIERTVLGVIFLAVVANALVQGGVPTYWEKVIYGGMLICAVLLEKYLYTKSTGIRETWKDFLLGGSNS
ncbi:MAG: ABC transporter permease [SAR324 cluster bacterium]|nr:ABC transporter permease [SAR324 cluster bacterium]